MSTLKHRQSSPPRPSPLPSLVPEESLPTFTPPSFTIKELQACIPAHCFERSYLRSYSYVAWDMVLIGSFIAATWWTLDWMKVNGGHDFFGYGTWAGWAARCAVWQTYAYFTGLAGTGIWVLAHECGHGGFSPSKTVNDITGWVLHSALLVPYFSWKISHGRHHIASGHMTRDQVWVPKTRSGMGLPTLEEMESRKSEFMKANPLPLDSVAKRSWFDKIEEICEESPLMTLLQLIGQQLAGWQLYISLNYTGPAQYPKDFSSSHFLPESPIYTPREKNLILLSDLGILITSAVLGFWAYTRGWQEVMLVYVIPYFWVNHWLVLITFLQHTDPAIPHYRDGEWNFARGALSTIDRNIHGWWFHGIAETHVAHHLFSKMPHYNAWEATDCLKEKLGKYYMKSDENFWISMWKAARNCRFVEDEGEVLFFKDGYGRAARRAVIKEEGQSDSGVDVN